MSYVCLFTSSGNTAIAICSTACFLWTLPCTTSIVTVVTYRCHDPLCPQDDGAMLFQTEAGLILSCFVAYFATWPPTKKSVSPKIPGELAAFDFTQGSRSSPLFTVAQTHDGDLYSSSNYVIIVLFTEPCISAWLSTNYWHRALATCLALC